MPLSKGSSHGTIAHNIQKLVREGRPKRQAVAISLAVAGKGRKRKKS